MNGYNPTPVLVNRTPVSIGASVTLQVISAPFGITAGGSRNILVAIRATAGTGTITATLQSAVNNDNAYVTAKTATIAAAAGITYIRLNVQNTSDQAVLPLGTVGRVAITTAGASSVAIDAVWVMQEL